MEVPCAFAFSTYMEVLFVKSSTGDRTTYNYDKIYMIYPRIPYKDIRIEAEDNTMGN